MKLSLWLVLLIAGRAFCQQSNPSLANPFTLPPATTGQVINGVSYSANYPQSALSERINACVADAETGANGNTSHRCDSSGEALSQTDPSGVTMVIGDAAGDKVTWIHPAYCNWSFIGFTGGTADAMVEFGGAAIEGNAPVVSHCMLFNNSVTSGMRAVFETVPTTGGNVYFSVKGMGFANEGVGVSSGATMVINSTNDGSIFEDLLVLNYVNGENSILFTGTTGFGACCATVLNRVVAAGNYTSGPVLRFDTSNFSGQTAVYVENSSFGHPASGQPNIQCNNSTIPPTAFAILSFDNIYLEGSNAGTAPFIQINSCQNIKISGVSMFARTAAASTQPGIQLNGTYNTALDVSALSMFKGFAAYPAIAVQNNVSGFNCASTPCNVMTDGGGNVAHYTNGTAQGDVINASVGFDVAGSPLAFTNLAGTANAAQGGTGTTNLSGLRYANDGSADTAASSSQVQTVIGSGVYVPLVSGAAESTSYRSTSATGDVSFAGGLDGGSTSTLGSGILSGANNSSTGGGGSALVEAGTSTSGQQGFANVQQSFAIATALSQTFEVVSMATTSDQVQASPLGATTNLGVAQTVGATNAQLYVVSTGKTTVRFDGTPAVGDIACFPPASTGTVGLAHDNGSTACTAGQKLGVITGQVSGTGSGATATVLLQIGS